jgi:hypothetical protein
MGWQPIETAPKDGTLVLVFYREGGMALRRVQKSGHTVDVLGRHSGYATHWMPLPDPPVSSQREPEGSGGEIRRQEREREGRIEGAIRLSERARIVAWLRTFAPIAEGRDVGALVDAIERGEHWRETL